MPPAGLRMVHPGRSTHKIQRFLIENFVYDKKTIYICACFSLSSTKKGRSKLNILFITMCDKSHHTSPLTKHLNSRQFQTPPKAVSGALAYDLHTSGGHRKGLSQTKIIVYKTVATGANPIQDLHAFSYAVSGEKTYFCTRDVAVRA